MIDLFYSSWSEAIGWSLIHSLWLGLIGVVLVWLISQLVSQNHSIIRYWLYLSIMLSVFVINIGLFVNASINSGTELMLSGIESELLPHSNVLNSKIEQLTSLGTNFHFILPYFVMFWWVGIIALLLRFFVSLLNVRKMTRLDQLPVEKALLNTFLNIKSKSGVKKMVKLVQSRHISVPSVVGYLKPIILLPIGLTSGLTNYQIEAILLHELSHIKRNDFLINIFQSVIEVIYFFNPFIWVISRFIRIEREHACDADAIGQGISPKLYAQTLTHVFSHALGHQKLALTFASKNKLTLKRIQRIMKTQSNNNSNKLIATSILMVAISFSMYFGAKSTASGQILAQIGPSSAMSIVPLPPLKVQNPTPILNVPTWPIDLGPDRIEPPDTIDVDELEKCRQGYDKALMKLKATKEWQKVQLISEELAKEHAESLKNIEPAITEAMRIAEEAMVINEQQLLEMEEKMSVLADEMADVDIDLNIEFDSRRIAEAIHDVEMDLEKIEVDELREMARQIAKEAAVVSKEAEKIAVEASVYGEKVDDFLSEIKPELVNDGHIKSEEELDSLKIEDGEVWVNGKKLSDKEAKKYIKVHQRYFGGKGFYMN